ncbi:MAG: hypothetical protein F6K30_11950 [Cyanothece sp. SIO2G6]|nr:hypothetical protein [Cyanothece sp. SIO2G6]
MKNYSDQAFREIAIADLTHFTLVLPTDVVETYRNPNAADIPVLERVYSQYGFVFMDGQDIGTVQGLRFAAMASKMAPLKMGSPLTQDIALTFEMVCPRDLPEAIAHHALFLYSFESDPTLHYGMFRNMVPSFVRIYPFESVGQLPQQVKCFTNEALQFHLQRQSDKP